MKNTITFCFLLWSTTTFAQVFQLQGYDVDTTNQEWSAMGTQHASILISTVDMPQTANQPVGMHVGNIRLRWYKYWENGAIAPVLDTTHLFQGKARVMSIVEAGPGQYILSGGFVDTLLLGNDTLINSDSFAFDAFVFKVNRLGQVLWVWSADRPQNNFFHKLKRHSLNNYALLAVGLADDVTGWLASIDPQTGQLLWEETVQGARTIADAQIRIEQGDTSMFVTGSCSGDLPLFGLQVPASLPVTGYQNFIYRRDLSNQQGQILKVVSHITFDFEATLSSYIALKWTTPATSDTSNQLVVDFIYHAASDNYIEFQAVSLQHHGIFSPVTIRSTAGWLSPRSYAVFRPYNSPIQQLAIHNFETQTNTYLNMGINTHQQWFGSFEEGDILWIAGVVGNEITYTGDFGPSGTISFPNINTNYPRWVLLGRNESVSVAEHKRQLTFDIYPNPVQYNKLTLRLNENNPNQARWVVQDMQGRFLLGGATHQNEQEIDLTGLSSGMYMLSVTIGNKSGVQKVVVP